MGTDIEWAVLLIVTKVMTPKAFSEGGCGSSTDGDMDNPSGGGEDQGSVRERLEKRPIESKNSFIDSSIFRLRFHGGRRGCASGGRGRRESRQESGRRGCGF